MTAFSEFRISSESLAPFICLNIFFCIFLFSSLTWFPLSNVSLPKITKRSRVNIYGKTFHAIQCSGHLIRLADRGVHHESDQVHPETRKMRQELRRLQNIKTGRYKGPMNIRFSLKTGLSLAAFVRQARRASRWKRARWQRITRITDWWLSPSPSAHKTRQQQNF